MEQVELLEGHFNAVPVAETTAESDGESGSAVDGYEVSDLGGAGGGSRLGLAGERQRIAEVVGASQPLARRVKVSQWSMTYGHGF